jgi:ubiquinone/menaquinone biosynthesis C-methylase UbiE
MKKEIFRITQSYEDHIKNETRLASDNSMPFCYTNPDSISNWRHNRMRKQIMALIKQYPGTEWLTLGDGEFGSDGYFLGQQGLDVTASSISGETLLLANKFGYIKKYKAINAEKIDEKDNSYDFVYCKEAYHHFPRPPVALYEMLRVTRKGIVLIEPQEAGSKVLDHIKKLVKLLIRHDQSFHFEPTGNYIYRVNIKEIIKMATAINLRLVCYKRFNDFYHPALASKSANKLSTAKIISLLGISLQNLLSKVGLMDFGLAVIFIFKENIDENYLKNLKEDGFRINKLPVNPYIL